MHVFNFKVYIMTKKINKVKWSLHNNYVHDLVKNTFKYNLINFNFNRQCLIYF